MVVLCGVGATLFFVFRNVNSAINTNIVQPNGPAIALFTSAPTAAPQLPPTEVPTPTELPSATPFPTPIAFIPFANVLLRDDFSSTSSGWDQMHEADYVMQYKNNSFHVVVSAQGGGQSVWIGDSYSNVSVEVDVTQGPGPDDGFIGVSCRIKPNVGGYGFEFARDGTYGIYKYTQGSPEALDEGMLDPDTVSPSGANHIEGICAGSTLTLILNGQPLLQVDDPTYITGGAGLIVRAGYSGDPGIDATFNQFQVKGP